MVDSGGDVALPFAEVYRRYSAAVYRFCLSMVRDPALAEDIGADTFVAAYRAYDRGPVDADGLRPWLFRIARNLVSDHLRKRRRRDRLLQFIGRSQRSEVDVESLAETNADLDAALAGLAAMSERDRLLLALRAGTDLSYREIGEVLGMSEHAASVATHRAINRLARLMEAE